MSYDDAIRALSKDALRFVKDRQVLGLGSGRAASRFVIELARHTKAKKMTVSGVPTSLQIRLVAEKAGITMSDSCRPHGIDVAFDGADQIDANGNLVKGGGGALLRERIVMDNAKRVVIMADATKFAKKLCMPIPVEVHPMARRTAAEAIGKLGGTVRLRTLEKGYPYFTENGNVILDCDFGQIDRPEQIRRSIADVAGVMEVGIFTRRPDVIYRAKSDGRFDTIR